MHEQVQVKLETNVENESCGINLAEGKHFIQSSSDNHQMFNTDCNGTDGTLHSSMTSLFEQSFQQDRLILNTIGDAKSDNDHTTMTVS